MLINILHPFSTQVDWEELLKKKQETIDRANIKENATRRYFDYEVGDKILIFNKAHKGKLEPTVLLEGPWWKITQVHTNRTVSILRNIYIYIRIDIERMNISRICPFF